MPLTAESMCMSGRLTNIAMCQKLRVIKPLVSKRHKH